ncbi:Transcription initiation factor Rrn11 [Cordyceps militaris]|uniref:Transcription initiation factor Rrn11 n=1 Tax=Cordyceps militaris TaxID=73501 RepID=A0A2H4SCC2_CORMI|nr:Transcription initiation factor Rrn11 [Cordyceps militaris]
MSGKRKRGSSFASDPSLPPPSAQAINPHSYPPAKLVQFAVAGLSDADEDPSQEIKDFPHRGFSHKPADSALESDNEAGLGEDSDAESKQTRAPDARALHLAVLVRSMHQLLGQGNVYKAARAFGLALQLRPQSRPVDIRKDNLWALGAEVIMREGEEQRNDLRRNQNRVERRKDELDQMIAGDGPRIPLRWGSAANMNKLRAYLETLIRQYPYDPKAPKKVSALHFNISLYSAEIYNIYAEHTTGLLGVDADADLDVDDSLVDESLVGDDAGLRLETLLEDESFHVTQTRHQDAALHSKDKVRTRTLAAIKAVVTHMDNLMRDLPYTKNHEMLRLRAAASLFMADLVVPFDETANPELHDVKEQRRRDIEVARRALQTVLESGGTLDEASRDLVESDDVDESLPMTSQIYSALPIRNAELFRTEMTNTREVDLG